jgi:hypothetical protein
MIDPPANLALFGAGHFLASAMVKKRDAAGQ